MEVLDDSFEFLTCQAPLSSAVLSPDIHLSYAFDMNLGSNPAPARFVYYRPTSYATTGISPSIVTPDSIGTSIVDFFFLVVLYIFILWLSAAVTISGKFVNLGPFAIVRITCSSFMVTATGYRIFKMTLNSFKIWNGRHKFFWLELLDAGKLMDATSQVTFVLGPVPIPRRMRSRAVVRQWQVPSNTTLHVRGPSSSQCKGLTCLNCTVATVTDQQHMVCFLSLSLSLSSHSLNTGYLTLSSAISNLISPTCSCPWQFM